MSIDLVTYANKTVTPTNDAIIYERAIDQNGIFNGCNVTVSSNNVNITGGYGIVCGREFVIESESIAVTLAPSGTLDGRLYVRLDLADADAPIQLLTATGNTLPPLEQDSDVNYTNGTYEMELATFTVGVSALSDVAETFETIEGTKGVNRVIEEGDDANGYWHYRKWSNGTAECWLSHNIGSVNLNKQNYRCYLNYTYPNSPPVSFASIYNLQGNAYSGSSSIRWENLSYDLVNQQMKGFLLSDTNNTASSGTQQYTGVRLYGYVFGEIA